MPEKNSVNFIFLAKMVSPFHRLPLGGKLCHVVAVMRGGYINEKQNFSEENSRYAAERILRNSLG